jgi:ABC-type nitrate/sulfonate/bicarbonate transport system substrate-binding protein
MLTNEMRDLSSVVMRVRAEAHPELDERFVRAVLQAEADAAGSDAAALQAIRRAVDEALGSAIA